MTKQIALTLGAALVAYFGLGLFSKKDKMKHKEKFQPKVALLGDVGGTNIRLQLVVILPPHNQPQRVIRQARYKVKEQPNFQGALRKFLEGLSQSQYPTVAAVAMAGPVKQNRLSMANAPQWGQINGNELGQNLNIKDFRLMNDFQANTYGILIIPDEQFVNLNEFKADMNKTIGIIGPGTGLGNSLLYTAPFRYRKRVYVLPSEGGHTDFPYIDDQALQFISFMKKKSPFHYISLERSFCGPAIPYMYQFFLQKFPQGQKLSEDDITSQNIMQKCKQQNPSVIFENVLRLFLKIYEAAISNFVVQHMCMGGLVLVGSLTNSLLPKIKNRDLMRPWKERHPEVAKNFQDLPILVCKQVDLGLKGAFVMARRIIADEQHDD